VLGVVTGYGQRITEGFLPDPMGLSHESAEAGRSGALGRTEDLEAGVVVNETVLLAQVSAFPSRLTSSQPGRSSQIGWRAPPGCQTRQRD
jgi:hypothetical protein